MLKSMGLNVDEIQATLEKLPVFAVQMEARIIAADATMKRIERKLDQIIEASQPEEESEIQAITRVSVVAVDSILMNPFDDLPNYTPHNESFLLTSQNPEILIRES